MDLDTQFFTHFAATIWVIGVVLLALAALIVVELYLAWDVLREAMGGNSNDDEDQTNDQ